jgi:aminoglycoside/choline kinase family phosphotransferase
VAGSARADRVSRERIIAAFLARVGYDAARTEPLAQDASFRRYLRLSGGPRRAVLMDAPPPEDIRPFVRIAGHLAGIGVSVPEIYAVDETQGLLLEEDFGNEHADRDAARSAAGRASRLEWSDHGSHRTGHAVRLVVARHVQRGRP